MKQLTIVICAALLALVLWRVIENISTDALGLAIGVFFGVLAGLPTAVLVLASNRRHENHDDCCRNQSRQQSYLPPVIVVNANQPQRGESDSDRRKYEANERRLEANLQPRQNQRRR